ncbi:MAG: transglycosylase-associated holin [Roseibaca calidilacus]|uniref:Transglycosylase-associated holin n=1 Tax=Roseibaca calidilacus TaxID=1666912 RepID=A0A0N8K846_9RHOB|nr:hypothetical protein [Roseibaca calidilacus]KPP93521.1 MAG: transglycosylase-associated holin [Roseibaca calidilacus]CUX80519.1 hypothetical protein Ga0058931_1181 [Roseibaca calidilacus]
MSLTQNILRSYRDPAGVVRGLAQGDLREPQVMFFALLACGLIFVAQWPGLSRAATIDTSVTFEQRMGGAMFGIMFLLPLILYGCAAVLKLGLRLSGANVPGILVRLALFWSLLTVTPLMLLQGGLSAFLGLGLVSQGFGFVVLLVFLYILARTVAAVRAVAISLG